jgi:hypothetical protein
MNQALYAHMNNKRKMKKKKECQKELEHHGYSLTFSSSTCKTQGPVSLCISSAGM